MVDPTPGQNTNGPANLWSGDALELFCGTEDLDRTGTLLPSDRQVLLGAGKAGQAYINHAPQQYDVRTAIAPRPDGKGYTLEAAIPWAALGFAAAPAEGTNLLFDLGIDDSADGKRRLRQFVWNGSEKNSGDRSYWGHATLIH